MDKKIYCIDCDEPLSDEEYKIHCSDCGTFHVDDCPNLPAFINEKLNKRIAELEAEIENRDREECCEAYKAKLISRIAELESERQIIKAPSLNSTNFSFYKAHLTAENAALRARVSTLEAEIEIGARHFNQVSALLDMERKENEALRAHIATIESAQQWHPASEPPEKMKHYSWTRTVLVCTKNGHLCSDYFEYKYGDWFGNPNNVTHWRDLPPMPEAKT